MNNEIERDTPTQQTWVWAHSSWRRNVEIGFMRRVAAHQVPINSEVTSHVSIPEKHYEATMEWREIKNPNDFQERPTALAAMPIDMAQKLMDALWSCGVRPVEALGSSGQLGAVERHLEDMRALTQHVLQCKLAEVRK